MNTDTLKITALTLLVALLLACAPMSFAADSAGGKTTGKNVAQKVDDTAGAIKNYSIEQRDEALKSAKKALAEADARIDHFEREIVKNWDTMNESARKHARETMKTLRRQRQDLSQSYGELKRSSSSAWDEVKNGFAKSYDALHDSFSKAAKEF
jgi:hypothetical protein